MGGPDLRLCFDYYSNVAMQASTCILPFGIKLITIYTDKKQLNH